MPRREQNLNALTLILPITKALIKGPISQIYHPVHSFFYCYPWIAPENTGAPITLIYRDHFTEIAVSIGHPLFLLSPHQCMYIKKPLCKIEAFHASSILQRVYDNTEKRYLASSESYATEVVSKKIGQLEGYYRDCARAGPGQEFQSS